MRNFDTGATRDTDENKPDYEGFLAPSVIEAYGAYMAKNRVQADGGIRSSDNWQKGIPKDVYMKSAWRHFFAAWKGHRAGAPITEELCGLLFNIMGYIFEEQREPVVEETTGWAGYSSQNPCGRLGCTQCYPPSVGLQGYVGE